MQLVKIILGDMAATVAVESAAHLLLYKVRTELMPFLYSLSHLVCSSCDTFGAARVRVEERQIVGQFGALFLPLSLQAVFVLALVKFTISKSEYFASHAGLAANTCINIC